MGWVWVLVFRVDGMVSSLGGGAETLVEKILVEKVVSYMDDFCDIKLDADQGDCGSVKRRLIETCCLRRPVEQKQRVGDTTVLMGQLVVDKDKPG